MKEIITCPYCYAEIDLELHSYITEQILQYEKAKQAIADNVDYFDGQHDDDGADYR